MTEEGNTWGRERKDRCSIRLPTATMGISVKLACIAGLEAPSISSAVSSEALLIWSLAATTSIHAADFKESLLQQLLLF